MHDVAGAGTRIVAALVQPERLLEPAGTLGIATKVVQHGALGGEVLECGEHR